MSSDDKYYRNVCLEIPICKCFVLANINFHPLEVVCRGSDTQLQVGENLNLKGL